jgi:hypothetical protein
MAANNNNKWVSVKGFPQYQVYYLTDPIRYLTPPVNIRIGKRFITIEETLDQQLRDKASDVLKAMNYMPKSFQVKYVWQDHIFSSLELQSGVTYVANVALICTYLTRNVERDEVIVKYKLKHLKTISVDFLNNIEN